MSSQESMFSPQENRPRPPEPNDYREQSYEQTTWQEEQPDTGSSSYETGYGGVTPTMDRIYGRGEKLRPPAPPSLHIWQWIIGAILLFVLASVVWSFINFIFGSIFLLLGLAMAAIAISQFFFVRSITMVPRTFTLEGKPTLSIQDIAGSIRIHKGTAHHVEVRATKYIYGWLASNEGTTIDFEQERDTIRVAPGGGYKWSPFGGLKNVNLDITVPEQCDIQIRVNASAIRLEGVSGQVRINTSAGTLHVEQATLEAFSDLTTSAGTVYMQQVTIKDQSSLTTSAGTIHMQQASLQGTVNIHTNAGTIYFAGQIAPGGIYHFDTNMGTIDAILPGDTSFRLNAKTNLGTIYNQFGSTTVGAAPYARLEVKSNLGTVSIRK